jgi:hypothetical protein
VAALGAIEVIERSALKVLSLKTAGGIAASRLIGGRHGIRE